jgi:phosphopantothenoylcysteine decarboxylase/phosphopantothenate--cysteine ligase
MSEGQSKRPSPPALDPGRKSVPAALPHSEATLPRRIPAEPGGLAKRRVVLAVTGSIAAYKAVLLLRLLLAEGARVSVVLSRSAREFVGAATFSGLTGEPVYEDAFDPNLGGELHVTLGRDADLVLVVPATADAIARLASGRADDLTSAVALSARCRVLLAPAMHPNMWSHPATARNVQTLLADGRTLFVGPVDGSVASGDSGMGRMAEPEAILAAAAAQVSGATLAGRHVVVTAGPTVEDIDPVRYVANRSSGKMGFALAEAAARRGARVTLIAGPVSLPTPLAVTRLDVRSAASMRQTLWQVLGSDLSGADVLVMAAAVADYRPADPSNEKLRRSGEPLALQLVPNPDLLAEIGRTRKSARPLLIGFSLGTESDERAIATARSKLVEKRVDLIVANHAEESIGRDDIRAHLVGARSCDLVERSSKRAAAERLMDLITAEISIDREPA